MNIQRFDPAYKAELEILKNKLSKVSGKDIQNSNLSHYEMGELRCAFEELVSWCINGENEQLNDALEYKWGNTKERPIMKDLVTCDFECVDAQSGYNIPEIVSISGHTSIMKTICRVILSKRNGKYFLKMGKSLEYAIVNEDEKMVESILSNSDSRDCLNFHNEYYGVSLSLNQIRKVSEPLIKYADSGICYIKNEVSNYKTAIQLASELGQIELVKLFLKNNANPNAYLSQSSNWTNRDNNKKSALHLAAENGHFEVVKELLKHGADMFSQDNRGKTPMQSAKSILSDCVSDQIKEDLQKVIELLTKQMTKKLQQLGPDYNAVLKHPEDYNYSNGEMRFKKLISICIDKKVNEKDDFDNKFTSPHLFFVKQNAQDVHTGYRAIDFAVINGNLETVRYLLQIGAQVEVKQCPEKYFSAIDLAIWKNNEPMVKLLIKNGLNSNTKRFTISVKKGLLNIAKNFSRGVNVDKISNTDGLNALHQATFQGRLDIVEYLVTEGANVNIRSGNKSLGRSALHFAVENGFTEIVEYLVEHGADVFQTDNAGLSPLEVLEKGSKMNYDFVKRIKKFLIDQLGIAPPDDSNVTHEVSEENKDKLVRFLSLKMGINDDENRESRSTSQKRKISDDDHVEEEQSKEKEDMLEPFTKIILNKDIPIEAKTKCIGALEVLILKNLVDFNLLARKEIIEEIGSIAETIIDKITEKESDQNLITIAKILNKISNLEQGKKLIKGIRMPIGAYERLKAEMNKQLIGEPSQFAFNSDSKKRIKTEIIDIDSE